MVKKIFIGLAPLLAIAALVVTDAAQATPHYFSNNSPLKESNGVVGEAGVKEVIGWGTLTLQLQPQGGPTTCHNAIGGMVWNPVGGGAGKGMTQASGLFDCETTFCATGTVVNVVQENLPWPSELNENGLAKTNKFRVLSTGVKMDVTCNGQSSGHFEGSYQPGAAAGEDKGTGAAHPGFLEFDQPGSGDLTEVELNGPIEPKGVVHELGYAEQELLQVK